MSDESLEDTYDWLDTDENYPLDPIHVFGWQEHPSMALWLRPWCEEHGNVVREQATAEMTSSEEDRREWIAENRQKLVKTCNEMQKTQKYARRGQMTWASPSAGPATVTHVAVWDAASGGNRVITREEQEELGKWLRANP